jgi:glycosyltransferase involved in cell wall biosynthesis
LKRSVLYISLDGLSDPLGQSQILPYLLGFPDHGYQVTVLSCEKAGNDGLVSAIKKSLEKKGVQWHFIPYRRDGGIGSRISYFMKLRRLAFGHVLRNRHTVIHCRSYLPSLIGLAAKKRFGTPFIFDMRGLWADERIDGDIWKKSNPLHRILYRFFKKKEREFALRADRIVSLTHRGAEELARLYGPELLERTTAIPCCADLTFFDRRCHAPLQVVGIDPGDHVLIYTGSVGTWYCMNEMLDCFAAWTQVIPRLKLLVVTRDLQLLNSLLNKRPAGMRDRVSGVTASFGDVPRYLAMAKAAIFFIKPAYSKIASSPTKMAECWAMGLPIITNTGIGDNDRFFSHGEAGVLVSAFNHEAYIRAAHEYLKFISSSHEIRKIAEEHFDQKQGLEAYVSIYQEISK